jgi:hypothetical protein
MLSDSGVAVDTAERTDGIFLDDRELDRSSDRTTLFHALFFVERREGRVTAGAPV